MKILILFFLTFGILFSESLDNYEQEYINSSYKNHLEEKKKVVIPEVVGLKIEDQKKLFDRSSKTYFEFPILSGSKPSIVIKTPWNQQYNESWGMLSCSDLGEKFDLKYARIKKMKTIVRAIFKNGKSEVLNEDDRKEYNSDGFDPIPISANNVMAFEGDSGPYGNSVKHFLIEIYIQDAFRKETGKLCVSEILPFADR
ncbi:hypothetical protein KQY10_02880 [Leptospira interrogans]|uniref:Uncharacterized protein n=1 Tax=Leptospira interrogans serovar Hardjo str. Norma TaxID=1279460 RepID=A0A0M3TM92_LEPIR|nr:hypothetical protein [Leptospira interrogans]ALE40431.1 hypothetical protein G436_3273 [Leptospira interrogans serovar Hardjo str. Norma]ALO01499.1 hypothetical protein LIH_14185 [Leptospira interrogans serovar Hardjo-prajitno]EKO96422.1 hypothetical protein LEP1GSC057_4635 [Leptospira interrogans str. Brem 329]MCD1164581.1 hypothetical protein [Leptospira interrogans]MCH1887223.1 hypothetical protein [Leptospira interrogans]